MKKSLFFLSLPFLAFSLASCGEIDKVTPVILSQGTYFEGEQTIEGNSHLLPIEIGQLNQLISEKANFVMIVHNTSSNYCSCWHSFHDDVLAPYIINHNLTVYMVDYTALSKEEDHYGLKLISNHETIGIFKDGKLAYQKDNSDEESDFVNKYSAFSTWMNARIQEPTMLEVSLEQLQKKYEGSDPFTIYFGRSTCPDCSYMENTSLKEYLLSHSNLEHFYYLDCDQEGIRYYNGSSPSDDEKASEDSKAAYAQWSKFKSEYGLTYSEDNPAGWNSGYVPTIFHINPEGGAKKIGDVIDMAGVFYNDTLDFDTSTVTSTYFTEERLQEECLSYLREGNVEKKVLLGASFTPFEGEPSEKRNYRHSQTKILQDPILQEFLDHAIGNP